jgi:hypothetical protein
MIDSKTQRGAELAFQLITEVRKADTEIKRGKKAPFTGILVVCDPDKQGILSPFLDDLKNFSRVEQIILGGKKPDKTPTGFLLISL